ncbi:hypothetical protein N7495_009088 [Penicillium taxi]|uniref:uncharacterized protein n=1 Tax=Penicillium taxi TaxID=168475 RepID=UPI002545A787|nr:uncharacterized protein N7495_009088 [Penicillium taxi]KAJ5889047.1 hypothetical protein N7495_009088 [Penicillium taxi]
MSINEKPIFVLVPGAWHTADGFDVVRDLLQKRGFESVAVATPSVGSTDIKTGLYADIGYTRGIIYDLVAKGRKVIIVGHSYGGSVSSGAAEGLGWAERSKNGLSGGVISVVWLSAFVTQKGQVNLDLLGGNWLPWMLPNDDGYIYSSQQEAIFYHDMTAEEQQSAISKLLPQPRRCFLEPITYESWHDIPSFFIFCDQDAALPLPFQEAFAAILKNPGTFHIESSHSPFFSVPEKVVEGLEQAEKHAQENI